MSEVLFNRVEVEAQLAVGLSKVVFYKTDGTTRELTCTRDMSLVPQDKHPVNEGKGSRSAAIPVYDVEEDCWKSFLLENLILIDKGV
jgi:hypothetical protein